MSKSRNTDPYFGTDEDYGTHVSMLRARARKKTPKADRNRQNSRREAIERSAREA